MLDMIDQCPSEASVDGAKLGLAMGPKAMTKATTNAMKKAKQTQVEATCPSHQTPPSPSPTSPWTPLPPRSPVSPWTLTDDDFAWDHNNNMVPWSWRAKATAKSKVKDKSKATIAKAKATIAKAKVLKKPAEKQTQEDNDDDGDDGAMEDDGDEQVMHEDGGDGDAEAEPDEGKATAKDYRDFWKALPFAKPQIQQAVKDAKTLGFRSGKQKTLATMALGFAKQGWDHKVFKSIESLEEQRSMTKKNIALPKVIMRAKCGGDALFQQAQ